MKRFVIVLAMLATFGACSKEEKSAKATTSEKAEPTAKAAVVPGSHEDWCEEHKVPESQCTLCDPKLAAAFKATNDWCVEHNLPESQCLKCNPGLKIDRPPKGK